MNFYFLLVCFLFTTIPSYDSQPTGREQGSRSVPEDDEDYGLNELFNENEDIIDNPSPEVREVPDVQRHPRIAEILQQNPDQVGADPYYARAERPVMLLPPALHPDGFRHWGMMRGIRRNPHIQEENWEIPEGTLEETPRRPNEFNLRNVQFDNRYYKLIRIPAA
ncbi:hypothetical protein SNEBB_011340 [Seison nebaliae]|nr:hypothetical protein SNEBB_011340 [Seison nebaliae]